MRAAQIQGRVNRFRVFREIKRVMEEEGRCPTIAEVAERLRLSHGTASAHYRALRNADGLPLPLATAADRARERALTGDGAGLIEHLRGYSSFGGAHAFTHDPGAPVPVDVMMRGLA